MKLAVMQPYFFPYIGYWQLLNLVDKFVIYEDVNYIKGGWINRNRIIVNGQSFYLTVPLRGASQNKKICDIEIAENWPWRRKMLKTISQAYGTAPHFHSVFPLVEDLLLDNSASLAEFLFHLIQKLAVSLCIGSEIVSSKSYGNADRSGADRIIDICVREGATEYVNLAGGTKLYSADLFREKNIRLNFLSTGVNSVSEDAQHFSILHLLMHRGADEMANSLRQYVITSAEPE